MDTPLPVPDRKSAVSAIRVDDPFSVAGLEVEIHVTHPRPSDLAVSLTSPAGTVVKLPLSGGSVTNFNGQMAAGDWKLTVKDGVRGMVGTLDSWSLHFTGVPVMSRSEIGGTTPHAFVRQAASDVIGAECNRVARRDVASFPFERGTESPGFVDQATVPSMQQRVMTYRAQIRLRVGPDRAIDLALAEESFVNESFHHEEVRWMWRL